MKILFIGATGMQGKPVSGEPDTPRITIASFAAGLT